jgi:hypothetical protein
LLNHFLSSHCKPNTSPKLTRGFWLLNKTLRNPPSHPHSIS